MQRVDLENVNLTDPIPLQVDFDFSVFFLLDELLPKAKEFCPAVNL